LAISQIPGILKIFPRKPLLTKSVGILWKKKLVFELENLHESGSFWSKKSIISKMSRFAI
jgi:hypothetical protein